MPVILNWAGPMRASRRVIGARGKCARLSTQWGRGSRFRGVPTFHLAAQWHGSFTVPVSIFPNNAHSILSSYAHISVCKGPQA